MDEIPEGAERKMFEINGPISACPFCMGQNVVLESAGYNGLGWVRCNDCASHGPEKGAHAEAIEAWNFAWVRAFEKQDGHQVVSSDGTTP